MQWTHGGTTIEAAQRGVCVHRDGGEQWFSLPEGAAAFLDCATATSDVDVDRVAEVLATARHGPLDRAPDPTGRPQVPRIFGFGGRGSTAPGAWIFGREVRFSALSYSDHRFDALLADGLPAGHGLAAETARALLDAVGALAPLPCPCGTGAQTPSQHGEIEILAGPLQHPRAPVTHQASVGRCRVCGRCRIFTESGDIHYSLFHGVSVPRGPDPS